MAPRKVAIAQPTTEQLELALPLTDQYALRLHAEQLRLACRDVCIAQTYERTADELDEIFGPSLGHHVSASLLRAAMEGSERNYWRGEWLPYFARRSPAVAALLASSAPAPLTAEQTLALMDQLGPEVLGTAYTRFRAQLKGTR